MWVLRGEEDEVLGMTAVIGDHVVYFRCELTGGYNVFYCLN